MKLKKKKQLLQKRRWRVRKKVAGSSDRPRLSVHFSNKHVYAQCIDDAKGATLCFISTLSKELKDKKLRPNLEGATALGKEFGTKAKAAGIEKVVFDRGGRRYHGCVKAFADAARESITF